jgi:drug/metabolite transporter (DMT)-like permease
VPLAPATRALLQIHLCVVIWGFTAILGKLITLPAFALVWWRMFLVVVVIAMLPAFWLGLRRMSPRSIVVFAGIGIVIALHWITFFASIKLANASVAATCMGVAPLIMSVVEPWITRRRFQPMELLIGVAAIPGVMLVVGGTPDAMRPGIAAGILSALLVAIFGSLNKRHIAAGEPLAVTGIELASGTAFMTLLALAFGAASTQVPVPDLRDFGLLLVLSIVCTLFTFVISLAALRHLSAYTAQLAVSLEPVYAVVLAILLLGEQRELGLQFYAGLAIILGSVLLHAARRA